jgi:hypothetical protein
MKWSNYYKRIPNVVKIGNENYHIYWVDGFPNRNLLGETKFSTHRSITINLNQSIKETVHTYWHEVLHAISEEFEANLTEKQVLALEKSLRFILKRGNLFMKESDKNAAIKRKR